MNIYTTEKNDGINVVDSRAALTPAGSTTLTSAVSSGSAIFCVDITELNDGATIRISPGLGAEEYFIVQARNIGANAASIYPDVANSHAGGATVQVEEFIPSESPDPDGTSRNKLVDGKLHHDYTLSAQLPALTYILDSGVAAPAVDDVAIFIKNFRSAPFTTGALNILTHNDADNVWTTTNAAEEHTIDTTKFGVGYGLALSGRSAVMNGRYIMAGLFGINQNEPVEISQIWLLQKHALTSTWEYKQNRQRITSSSMHKHSSGIIDVISHSSEPRRRITGLFKNQTDAEVEALFEILRLSRGPLRPIIIDPLENRAPDELILARFASDAAIKESRIDFDLWNVTIELETLQLPDDL